MAEGRNPFETPIAESSIVEVAENNENVYSIPNRYRRTAWFLVFLYPGWLALSFYAVWLLAWYELGHRPRPMLDDPKSVGGMLTILYYLPGIVLMVAPIFAPLGLALCFLFPARMRFVRRVVIGFALALLYVVLWAGTMNLLVGSSGGGRMVVRLVFCKQLRDRIIQCVTNSLTNPLRS